MEKNADEQYNKMVNTPVSKLITKLAIPTIISTIQKTSSTKKPYWTTEGKKSFRSFPQTHFACRKNPPSSSKALRKSYKPRKKRRRLQDRRRLFCLPSVFVRLLAFQNVLHICRQCEGSRMKPRIVVAGFDAELFPFFPSYALDRVVFF